MAIKQTNKKSTFVKKIETTRWRNDLKVMQRVKLYPEGQVQQNPHYHTLDVEWAPGEEVELPSEYDHAIQSVKDGVIIGGLAPMLTRIGSKDKLHDSLNVPLQEEILESRMLAADLIKRDVLNKAAEIRLQKLENKK